MQDLSRESLLVGSHVFVHGLVSKTELNDKLGFIVNQQTDRWGVVMMELDCEPGRRQIWNIKPNNLKALASSMALKVTPSGDSNVANAKIEPFDFNLEWDMLQGFEKRHVAKVTGWTNVSVSNKFFYSKYSPYADLSCYWNGNEKTGPVHPMSSAVPGNVVIRGPAIFVRGTPPIARIMVIADGVNRMVAVQDPSPWAVKIAIHEMMDTLKYYQNTTFDAVNPTRTSKRQVLHKNLAYEQLFQNM